LDKGKSLRDLTQEQQLTWDILKHSHVIKYRYVHDECGGVAFISNYKPEEGSLMMSEGMYHTDHTPMQIGESIVCDACNKRILNLSSSHFYKIFLYNEVTQ
jgi:hypothetical protein